MATRRKKQGRRGLHNKRHAPDEQVVQREAAFAAIRLLYSEVLPVWRACGRGFCRRNVRCGGDAAVCITRTWPLLPPAQQEAAYHHVVAGGPRRVPPATHTEWELRRFPPSNFVR
jgi:hypothetical protein